MAERVKVRVTMGRAAQPRRGGWAVYRGPQGSLHLSPGSDERWPFVLVGWTEGSRRDGEALLAELRATESR